MRIDIAHGGRGGREGGREEWCVSLEEKREKELGEGEEEDLSLLLLLIARIAWMDEEGARQEKEEGEGEGRAHLQNDKMKDVFAGRTQDV